MKHVLCVYLAVYSFFTGGWYKSLVSRLQDGFIQSLRRQEPDERRPRRRELRVRCPRLWKAGAVEQVDPANAQDGYKHQGPGPQGICR